MHTHPLTVAIRTALFELCVHPYPQLYQWEQR